MNTGTVKEWELGSMKPNHSLCR